MQASRAPSGFVRMAGPYRCASNLFQEMSALDNEVAGEDHSPCWSGQGANGCPEVNFRSIAGSPFLITGSGSDSSDVPLSEAVTALRNRIGRGMDPVARTYRKCHHDIGFRGRDRSPVIPGGKRRLDGLPNASDHQRTSVRLRAPGGRINGLLAIHAWLRQPQKICVWHLRCALPQG